MESVCFQQDDLTILHANFIQSTLIPPASIDLLVTSPPYNVDISYSSVRDDGPYEEYLSLPVHGWRKRTRS
jgi:hypothetical protein